MFERYQDVGTRTSPGLYRTLLAAITTLETMFASTDGSYPRVSVEY